MKKYWTYILFLPLLLLCVMTHAQNGIVSAGGDNSGSTGSVAYSVGQMLYTHYIGEAGSVNLGVQQPDVFIMVSTDETALASGINLYPNPAQDHVYIDVDAQSPGFSFDEMVYRLYDVDGKQVSTQDIDQPLTTVPVDMLHDGMYIMRIMKKNEQITSFKLFKTH